MSIHIADLLDKAKVVHSLPSDYKLALVMGISHSALVSYRQGKTLPDARVISKICDLTGDDPAILAAQIEEERAKTPEAKFLWHMISERLAMTARSGVVAGVFSAVALGLLSPASSAHAAELGAQGSQTLCIMSNRHRRRETIRRYHKHPVFHKLRRLVSRTVEPFFLAFRGENYVQCTESNAFAVRHVSRPRVTRSRGACRKAARGS